MSDEREPCIRITTEDGEVIEATKQNTSLWQYTGDLASRSHVFVETGRNEDGRQRKGAFVFKFESSFERMLEFMVEHDYPCHVNLTEVTPGDEAAYQQTIEQRAATDIADFDSEIDNLLGDNGQ